jgi:hypothetical protein
MRTTGRLAIAAGAMFFLANAYLFIVLAGAGWTIDMFDDPSALLPWVHEHIRLYQGLWLLYFLSQALLLLVPWRVAEDLEDRAVGVLGTVAITIAIVGLVIIFAASPVTARAYQASADGQIVLVLHELAADLGKYLRLFSQLLLGAWMILVGRRLQQRTSTKTWLLFSALGVWTVLVSAWKLFDPYMALEDWLGFLLGLGYLALGGGLLRTRLSSPSNTDSPLVAPMTAPEVQDASSEARNT